MPSWQSFGHVLQAVVERAISPETVSEADRATMAYSIGIGKYRAPIMACDDIPGLGITGL
jgi:hypothetical protein